VSEIAVQTPQRGVAARTPEALTQPLLEQKEAIASLLTALRDPAAEVRLAAAEALGKIGDTSVMPALTQALQDPDSHVRASAARSMGEIGAKGSP
jgi:HEAT repeat protein